MRYTQKSKRKKYFKENQNKNFKPYKKITGDDIK